MNIKYRNYIGIAQGDGLNSVKYVTGFGEQHNTMLWEYNKPAMKFSLETANDYIYGLNLNGNAAILIRIPDWMICLVGNYDPALYGMTDDPAQYLNNDEVNNNDE